MPITALVTLTSMLATKASRYWPGNRALTCPSVNPPPGDWKVLMMRATTGTAMKNAA